MPSLRKWRQSRMFGGMAAARRAQPGYSALLAAKAAIEPAMSELYRSQAAAEKRIVNSHWMSKALLPFEECAAQIERKLFAGLVITLCMMISKFRWWALGMWVLALAVPILVGVLKQVAERRARIDLRLEFDRLDADRAQNPIRRAKLERDLELRYEAFSGYPPDWDSRRSAVLARDSHCCRQCGYPDGYKTRPRKLHVHHIRSLRDGGTNAMSNLVTLCSRCHSATHRKST
jgi:5-methylcytosine-specific restriction endonuclease McrA